MTQQPTCPVCDRPTPSPETLCSAECVRRAVHEIERLSRRRKHLQRQDRRSGDPSVLARLFGSGGETNDDELSELGTRTEQLMAALMATDHDPPAVRTAWT